MTAGNRVKVTNQQSEYRNHLGTVLKVDGNNIHVRIDGQRTKGTILFRPGDLRITEQGAPVIY